jgi:hypothetical protein
MIRILVWQRICNLVDDALAYQLLERRSGWVVGSGRK